MKGLSEGLKKDVGVQAVLRFYDTCGVEKVTSTAEFQECLKAPQCNMSFRVVPDLFPVPCRIAVQEFVRKSTNRNEPDENSQNSKVNSKTGICLVTGETGEIARTHGRTPINKDTKCLIGFQKNSGYDSYGKEQGYNAPVIKSSEFAYVTALNTLLKSGSQRMSIGDASTVFWSREKPTLN